MGLGEHDVRPEPIGRYPRGSARRLGASIAGCACVARSKTPRFLSRPGNIAEAMSCLKKSQGSWGQSPQRRHKGGEAASARPDRAAEKCSTVRLKKSAAVPGCPTKTVTPSKDS